MSGGWNINSNMRRNNNQFIKLLNNIVEDITAHLFTKCDYTWKSSTLL